MNPPRISLPGRRTPEPTRTGNGGAPKLRLREQAHPPSVAPSDGAGPRRLLQPLPLVGLALVLVALVGYWAIYNASTKRTAILVTTHTLPAGALIATGDVRTAELAGDRSVLASLAPGSELSQLVGRRLASALPGGVPVPSAALATQQLQTSAMTLAVPEFDVNGASLQPGESVTVLATFGAGTGAASTRPIARALQIVSVGEAPSNADPSTATVPVTVSVTNPSIASALALANEDAKLDLLLEGSNAPRRSPR